MTAIVPGLFRHGLLELLEVPQGLREGSVRVVLIQEDGQPSPRLLTFGKYQGSNLSSPESFQDAEWHGVELDQFHG